MASGGFGDAIVDSPTVPSTRRGRSKGAQFNPEYQHTSERTFPMTESKIKMLSHMNTVNSVLIAVGPTCAGSAIGIAVDAFVLDDTPRSHQTALFVIIGILALGAVLSGCWFVVNQINIHNEAPDCKERWPRFPGIKPMFLRFSKTFWYGSPSSPSQSQPPNPPQS